MDLNKIYIILDRPSKSSNIGAACRAMANNGIKHLRIVGCKEDYDDEKIRILAIHASSLWDSADFFSSITEATADCFISAGTTRRRGKNRKGKLLFPEELADQLNTATGETDLKGGRAAVVFGNERTGLTDKEMKECMIGVTIPSSPEFASLNLSHAVQIICYHIFREQNKGCIGYTPITLDRLEEIVKYITDKQKDIGFFSVTGRGDMEQFWKEILSRARLSEGEAQYFEKIFKKTAGLCIKNRNQKSNNQK